MAVATATRPGAGRAADVRRHRLHLGARHPPVLAAGDQPRRIARVDGAVEPRGGRPGPLDETLDRAESGRCRIRVPGFGRSDPRPGAELRNELPPTISAHLVWPPARNATCWPKPGLVAPQLPAPWGVGASPVQLAIINEEFDDRPDLTKPSLGIAEWILPTILDAGTDRQRERFAWPILRGVQRWCQLFSEPGAGSDLASLSTRARKVDGGWLINGHKIWTSQADRAQFGALLARTDPDASKHRGISYFLVDMASPGITVEPIKQASGHFDFNEVFLDRRVRPRRHARRKAGRGLRMARQLATMACPSPRRSATTSNIDRRGRASAHRADRRSRPGRRAARSSATLEAQHRRDQSHGAAGDAASGRRPGRGHRRSSIAKYADGAAARARASTATLRLTGRAALLEDSDPATSSPARTSPCRPS